MKKLTMILALVLALGVLPVGAAGVEYLIPGGQVIGLELRNDTVTVVALEEGCRTPLKTGDRILSVDGRAVHCTEDVREAMKHCGATVEVAVQRGGKQLSLDITPRITEDGARLGVYLRSGITGIGTVTFYDPENRLFGTLGHGVNDDSGKLLKMTEGSVYPAQVASVRKGQSGEPGQLMGTLSDDTPMGGLTKNTARGVFGTAEATPGQPLPVGDAEGVKTGTATILSTVEDSQVQAYSVEILKIYPKGRSGGRNLLLRVTDPALLAATGGIVQGMSGSPIIQDGKLIGAVTHVLVNDPTTGYGIFIENMLDAAA